MPLVYWQVISTHSQEYFRLFVFPITLAPGVASIFVVNGELLLRSHMGARAHMRFRPILP